MNTSIEIKPGVSVTRYNVEAIIIADVAQLMRKLKKNVQRIKLINFK